MAKNTCAPSTIFGAFDRWLFLGCSVVDFTCSLGWNEQASSLSVRLVQDTCTGETRRFYDSNLNIQETTAADPGFMGLNQDIEGCPVYFRVGNFEFVGIIQSWNEHLGPEGNPIYTVVINDPRNLLEGVQLIVGNYAGSVGNAYNAFNVYGFMEAFGIPCPNFTFGGAEFGSPAGAFGGSLSNENGMSWNRIKQGLHILTSAIPISPNTFSPYGRIVFKGASSGGYGLFPFDVHDVTIPENFPNVSGYLSRYLLDLTEIPTTPDYWRFQGPFISLLEAISQVCDDAGVDYYVELTPVKISGAIYKIIKFRTVSRANQTNLNAINNFIGDGSNTINSTIGRELRAEPTTSVLIGGYKQVIYQSPTGSDPEGNGESVPPEADDLVVPFWGLDQSGNAIIGTGMGDGHTFTADIRGLHTFVPELSSRNTVGINIGQLRAALAGKDMWQSYVSAQQHHFATGLGIDGIYKFTTNIVDNINQMGQNGDFDGAALRVRADDLIKKNQNVLPRLESQGHKIDVVYQFVLSYAEELYGKKFMVRLPYSCVTIDPESRKSVVSEEPSDGGWTDEPCIIGLPNPSVFTDFFRLDDGRVGGYCSFGRISGANPHNLSTDDYIFVSGVSGLCGLSGATGDNLIDLYVKTTVEPQLVYLNYATKLSPRVVVTLPQRVKRKLTDNALPAKMQLLADIYSLMSSTLTEAQKTEVFRRIAQNKLANTILNEPGDGTAAIYPTKFAIPLKSNISTYGPWISRGPAGPVRITHDEGLVPWEFNGTGTLQLAGLSRVDDGVTNLQQVERGSITIPGYPTIPLGAELGAENSGIGGYWTIDGRDLSTLNFSGTISGTNQSIDSGYVDFGAWDGSYGPNVTNIDVEVGIQGVQTTYSMQTYTPKFGRFTKGNAERLKNVGKIKQNENKRLRALQFKTTLNQFIKKTGRTPFIPQSKGDESSPATYLVGQLTRWDATLGSSTGALNLRSSEIALHDGKQLATEFQSDIYSSLAAASLDSIFRPVSLGGDGGLPRLATPTGVYCNTNSELAQPPVTNPNTNQLEYDIFITRDYLNPFTNPNASLSWSAKHVSNPANSAGHDIDFLARGSVPPDHHSFRYAVTGYTSDYRFLALRGPLVMHGWGYDTNGKPIPNFADTEPQAALGRFVDENLHDKFLDDFLRKSHTWPVAPIDLRYDRTRGVWVAPPTYKLVFGEFRETCSPFSSGLAEQIRGMQIWDSGGNPMGPEEDDPNNARFYCQDLLGIGARSGDKFIAYYSADGCEYWLLEVKQSGAQLFIGTTGCTSGGTAPAPFNIVTLETGLSLEDLGNGHASIGLNFQVANSGSKCSITSPYSTRERINGIHFCTGLLVGDDHECRTHVALDFHVGPLSTGVNACTGNKLTFTVPTVSILAATGLYFARVPDNDCKSYIGLDLLAFKTSGCLTGTPVNNKSFARINFGEGLAAFDTGPCTITTALNTRWQDAYGNERDGLSTFRFGSGISISNSGCTGLFDPILRIAYDSGTACESDADLLRGNLSPRILTFGKGLRAKNAQDDVKVHLYMDIISSTGTVKAQELFFGSGLTVSLDGCRAIISATGIPSGGSGNCRVKIIETGCCDVLANLYNDMEENTFTSTQDLTINSSYSGCGITVFIDASSIAGYDQSKGQVLGHGAGGSWKWYDLTGCSG